MIGTARPTRGCVRAASLFIVILLVNGRAWAADDDVRATDVVGDQPADEDGNLVDLGANFDTNVFDQGGNGWVIQHRGVNNLGGRWPGGDGPEAAPAVARIRALGAAQIERVERACTLSEAQRRKLELALEADIRRCVAEIEQVRRRYAGSSVNMRDREGQQKWHRFQQDVQRCRRRLLTLFEESSLFAECLPTVLDEMQFAALEAETSSRRSFRWRSLVGTALLRLDDMLALDQEQHEELERLLLEREPPLRLDPPSHQRNDQAEKMLVFMVLAEVDQKALRATVGEDRWKAVVMLANQGRSMRSWIEGQGLLQPQRR